MSKGKIASQVSHVAFLLSDFKKPIGRSIVLKADLKTLLSFLDYPEVRYIHDAGLTEVPEGSLTCIGFIQTPFMKKFTKNLKLV